MTVGAMDFSAGPVFGARSDSESSGSGGFGTPEPIAIIGAAGRFALAADLEEYWANLRYGRNGHRRFPGDRARAGARAARDKAGAGLGTSYPAGYLDDIAAFDHAFFEISFREACLMDPNQRIFLEEAYRALESAGYTGPALRDFDTGVYVGHSADLTAAYADFVRDEHPTVFPEISVAGNMSSVIASRLAYHLDLRGPCVVVDTACSSSLVAVHIASEALRSGQIRMAVVGSVKVNIAPLGPGPDDELGIRSAHHQTRTFDAAADGISSGEGAAAVVLKRLDDALADGDRILAVIRASAVNQDGRTVGITAPNPRAQEELLSGCWEAAGIDVEDLVYLEAHGTGTTLGDPIEVSAMSAALRRHTSRRGFCAVGSVKPSLGHLDHLAGLASLVKVVAMLGHRTIPPTIHFETPNRHIDFVDSGLYVADVLHPMPAEVERPLCGVSSFGLAGTNCHVLLEHYPPTVTTGSPGPHLLAISAKTSAQRSALVGDYIVALTASQGIDDDLAAVCRTAADGRPAFPMRLACVADSSAQLVDALQRWLADDAEPSVLANSVRAREVPSGGDLPESVPRDGAARRAVLTDVARRFVAGDDSALALVREPGEGRSRLPHHPLRRIPCWAAEIDQPPEGVRLERLVDTGDETFFRIALDLSTDWVLAEHRVDSDCVLPGAAIVDAVVTAVRTRGRGSAGPIVLERVFFLRPVTVPLGSSAALMVALTRDHSGEAFRVLGSIDGGPWDTHVIGAVRYPEDAVAADIAVPPDTALRLVGPDEERPVAVSIGGHWTRISRELREQDAMTSWGRFHVPDSDAAAFAGFHLYPPLLDRALNALNTHIGSGTYLPFSVDRLVVHRPLDRTCVARLTRRPSDGLDRSLLLDIVLTDAAGRVALTATDYCLLQHHARHLAPLRQIDDYVREVYWAPIETPGAGASSGESLLVLLLPDGAETLGAAFRARHDRVVTLSGPAASLADQVERLLDSRPGPVHLVVGAGLHPGLTTGVSTGLTTGLTELTAAVSDGPQALVRLVQLVGRESAPVAAITVLTANAFDQPVRPEASLTWGLSKVVNAEFGRVRCRVIDVDDTTPDEVIVAEVLADGRPDQVRLSAGRPKIQRARPVVLDTPDQSALSIRQGGHYLLTGGAGDLARVVTEHLASTSPCHVTVLDRLPEQECAGWPEHRAVIEAHGSTLDYVQCDITDPRAVDDAITASVAARGPLRGVLHLAGVLGDRLIMRVEEEAFVDLLRPKVHGTWVIDHATRAQPLDFFLMFSSISSLMGGIGQAGYVTANTYLDQYPASRTGPGLSMTVNWAAWAEQGMAVRMGLDESRNNLYSLANAEALQCFDAVLRHPRPHVVVGRPNRRVLEQSSRTSMIFDDDERREQPLAEVRVTAPSAANGNGVYTTTETSVAAAWRAVLGNPVIDVHANFTEAGGDSILAVRLLDALRADFGDLVDITSVFTYPTIHLMADYLDRHGQPVGAATTVSGNDPADDELDRILAGLASGDLSVQDAERLY